MSGSNEIGKRKRFFPKTPLRRTAGDGLRCLNAERTAYHVIHEFQKEICCRLGGFYFVYL